MGAAKVVSLAGRPLQASHLCFDGGGILGQLNAQLGDPVTAFDFPAFYATLGSIPTLPGDLSRLLYDFLEIQAFAKPATLGELRAEPLKAALSKAINARQNAYFAKYGSAPAIISQMNQYFTPGVFNSKPQRLATLSNIAETQWKELRLAYVADGRVGVVKNTTSALTSSTETSGSTHASGQTVDDTVGIQTNPGPFPNPPPDGKAWGGTTTGDLPVNESFQQGTNSQDTIMRDFARQQQGIVNTDYGYRIPYLEGAAQYERAQISLIDQQFAQFMFAQSLPHMSQVFRNELQSIDGDVFQLQIAFLNTLLMSPIAGVVTGVYKNPGDPVRPGEPVIRVENNDAVLLIATLVYRGPVVVGSSVTVDTTLFDLPGPPTTIAGSVVSVRGHHDDDQWEVIVKCNNLDGGGKAIFPLGYHFDYDDTTVTIT